MEAVILADLAARYPDGYVSFTRGGKRTVTPTIYPRIFGFVVSVNGLWHRYGHDGAFDGAGPRVGYRQPRKTPRAPSNRERAGQGPSLAKQAFLDRKIREIRTRTTP